MNKRVIIVSALGLVTMFGVGTGFAFDFFGKSSIDLPLQEVSFTSGGDMLGSYHGMSVRLTDKNSALVCYEDASWHNEAIGVKEYIVPASVLEDVKTIFNDNKLARCEKAGKSKFLALDAATNSYHFYFDKKSVYFSSTQNLSRENYNALREIKKCVSAACEKGQRLPGLVLEKDKDGNLPLRRPIVKDEFIVRVVGYKNKRLTISVGNDLEEAKKVVFKSKITELNKPETIVVEKISDQSVTVDKHDNYEYTWELDKRLEAGKYSLDFDGYTTDFEIK